MDSCYLGAISLLLFCLSPSSAYLDGAREESCYNHSIRHRADLGGGLFQSATTATCSPCSYELVLTREIRDGNDTQKNFTEPFDFYSGATYEFELRAIVNGYLGFLIQARYDNGTGVFDQSSSIVGTWDNGTDHKPLNCGESMSFSQPTSPNSVTHANAENFRGRNAPYSTTLRWTAPSDPPAGNITFWYTIVQQLLNDFHPVAGPVGMWVPSPTEPPIPEPTRPEPITETPTEPTTQPVIKLTTGPNSTTNSTSSPIPSQKPTQEPGQSMVAIVGIAVEAGIIVVLIVALMVVSICAGFFCHKSKKVNNVVPIANSNKSSM